MRRTYEQSLGFLSKRLQELLDEKGWTIKELADKLGRYTTYESVRRWVNESDKIPSAGNIKLLADALDADEEELLKLANAAKIDKDYGGVAVELAGKNPEVEPFQRGFHLLNEKQKDTLLTQFKVFLSQNRKHRGPTEKMPISKEAQRRRRKAQ